MPDCVLCVTLNCAFRAELTFPRHVEFLMPDGDHAALNCAFRAELRASRNFELHFLSFMQTLRQTDAARNSS